MPGQFPRYLPKSSALPDKIPAAAIGARRRATRSGDKAVAAAEAVNIRKTRMTDIEIARGPRERLPKPADVRTFPGRSFTHCDDFRGMVSSNAEFRTAKRRFGVRVGDDDFKLIVDFVVRTSRAG